MDAIAAFADHVVATRFQDLPAEALSAAKIFILDTLGVGIAGSGSHGARRLADVQEEWGRGEEARVWGNGKRLPAPAAAFCNAYQAHSSEFDCVHEEAVVHAMTVVLPVAIASAERMRGVSGETMVTAVTLGVDVAASLGVAATSGLRFFRPATAGAFGATAALGKLMGLDRPAMIDAFSIAYSQLCGTMQAHTEGSDLLAMQMGFNARNAFVACDLAARGFDGPKNVLEGRFGYFTLFETSGAPARVVQDLGRRWFITELAHKPFPSGRATHGILEACLALRQQPGFSVNLIGSVTARVPPLVQHLVGRPPQQEMTDSYARLCASYVAACALLKGSVTAEDFTRQAYRNARTQHIAQCFAMHMQDADDPNALTPVEVEIDLRDGSRHTRKIEVVYGNPAKPLSREDHLRKFRSNCEAAARPLPADKIDRLIERVDRLEEVSAVGQLVDLMAT